MRMTISIPHKIAKKFCKKVPRRYRSRVIAHFMEAESNRLDAKPKEACLKANRNKNLEKEIDEWQSFEETIEE